ncbi:unnamed protein product [Trichobilharzia regenti]|nr:unnamed protein product [Trichobilharzia regenti]
MPTSMFHLMSSSHTKSTVFISGTLVNKEDTSNDIMNLLSTFKSFIVSTNPKVSFTLCCINSVCKGCKSSTNYLATGWHGELNIYNTGRSGTPLLYTLGEPYNFGVNVPVGFSDVH